MSAEEKFRRMWETLCFESAYPGGPAVCTRKRGHKGPHRCDFEKLERFHAARRAIRVKR